MRPEVEASRCWKLGRAVSVGKAVGPNLDSFLSRFLLRNHRCLAQDRDCQWCTARVKQSGGFVWAESEPGHGTVMKVYWPEMPGGTFAQSEETTVPLRAASHRYYGRTITILASEGTPDPLIKNSI